ncbi:MAG: type IX secretion system protein PorQ, partial [Bacteroidia bacterium]|nr:type IX secretion system protein PorQ [Bacteroidia bacterium]
MKRLILIFTLAVSLASPSLVHAQIGGTTIYQLLNLPPSARSAALGGLVPGAWDDDPALVYHNPALANPGMNNQLSLNYSKYLADIRYGYLAYSHDLGKWGTPVIGIQYINYGTFIEANEFGDILGNFSAAEYSLNLTHSYALDSLLSVGITIRPIYSVLERYTSWGLGSDFGIHYHSANNRFAFTLVARNFGSQLTTYATPEREKLPFEVLSGINFKLKHAPFRLHLTARNLQRYNLRPASEILPDSASFIKKSGRNIILALDHI